MREIKFRAKTIKDGRWVYGHYFISPLTDEDSGTQLDAGWFFLTGEKRHCIANENGAVFVIDEKTLGQYTSLKDKNGKEIYEGDLLWNGDVGAVWRVEWCEGGYWSLCDKEVCESKPINSLHFLEIIGNIYSNPSLIK